MVEHRFQQPGEFHREDELGRRTGSERPQGLQVLEAHRIGIHRVRYDEDLVKRTITMLPRLSKTAHMAYMRDGRQNSVR